VSTPPTYVAEASALRIGDHRLELIASDAIGTSHNKIHNGAILTRNGLLVVESPAFETYFWGQQSSGV
jgi:hypothetical protein